MITTLPATVFASILFGFHSFFMPRDRRLSSLAPRTFSCWAADVPRRLTCTLFVSV